MTMLFVERFSAQLAIWLSLIILPAVYFLNETGAILALFVASATGAIFYGFSLYRDKTSFTAEFRTILFLLATWLFLAGRASLASIDSSTSWPVFIKVVALSLFTLVVALALKSVDSTVIFKTACWAGIIHGIIAIQEYIEAPPIPATWLDPAMRTFFKTRCAGIFTDPNIFAAFLSVVFLLCVGQLIIANSLQQRCLATISILLSGTAIMTTLSRGSWIALSAGILVLMFCAFIYRKTIIHANKILLAVAGLIMLIVFLAGPFKMRLLSITKPSDMTFAQRTLINRGIFASIGRFPIAGHGLHTFNQIYPKYRIVGGDYPMNAHNEFLHSMLETGYLSSLLLAFICMWLGKTAWSAIKKHGIEPAVFAAAFLSLFVHNLSGFSSRILPTSLLIAFCAGGILAFSFKNNLCRPAAVTFKNGMAALLIAAGIFTLWQGLRITALQNKIIEANKLLYDPNPQAALVLLNQILLNDPANSIVCSMLSSAQVKLGDLPAAINALQKAISLNDQEALFHINLARLQTLNEPEAAEKSYIAALQLDPASELYRLEYARFLLTQGRRAEALNQLNIALSYSPGFHQVYTNYLVIEKLKKELETTAN